MHERHSLPMAKFTKVAPCLPLLSRCRLVLRDPARSRPIGLLIPSVAPLPRRVCAPKLAFHARFLAVLAASLLGGCATLQQGILNPAGPVASGERHLLLLTGLVLLFVVVPVVLLTPIFAWHYRLANTRNAFRPKWSFSWILEFFIWIPPTLIVAGLAVLLWRGSQQFDPYTPALPGTPLEVQAVALDWKWLFIYPEAHIATVNELVIPAARPIHIRLTSGTVMQSMFVPQLAGQIYAMAGMITELNLAADKPGVFQGRNTQYNGEGFAQDTFEVISMTALDYAAWVRHSQAAAPTWGADALSRLFTRTVEPRALYFSAIPGTLFPQILARAHSATGQFAPTGAPP